MDHQLWTDVDGYLVSRLIPTDSSLDKALADSTAAGLPEINVAPNQGKLLELLARGHRSQRILEIGTLGGYSTIWLARSPPTNGDLISLELEEKHAEVARRNIERAGHSGRVSVRVGPAAASLRELISEGVEPFDFIFIDADKEGYPEYFALCLELSRPGTMIVADNVVRNGEVGNAESTDPRVKGVQAFLELVSAEKRVDATAVQTVGSKDYDGFALILVTN
jgi:predicted O-methyltransferase YrrM